MNREPIFNVPGIVLGLTAAFVIIHVVRLWVLTDEQDIDLLLLFAFIPVRYEGSVAGVFPGGLGAQVWTFVTYAFLHANWPHVGLNILWLLPFGSALARRFGAVRFFVFMAVTAAAGALAHLVTHEHAIAPMIGASASVSGTMAAAMVPGTFLARRHTSRATSIGQSAAVASCCIVYRRSPGRIARSSASNAT